MGSIWEGSKSGLDLERSRPYRTDAFSIRATGGSPPSASLEDISRDEKMDELSDQVKSWLSSVETDGNVIPCHELLSLRLTCSRHFDSQAVRNSISSAVQSLLTCYRHF